MRITYVNGDMRNGLNVVGKIDAPAISGLQVSQVFVIPSNDEFLAGRTSGDPSDKITAPRVSTWITRGVGNIVRLGGGVNERRCSVRSH